MEKIIFLLIAVISFGCSSQTTSVKVKNNDNLYITFDNKTVNQTVFVNTIDMFGTALTQKNKQNRILVLFATKKDAQLLLRQTKYRDSLYNIGKIIGGNPKSYGIELEYYSLTLKEAQKNIEDFQKTVKKLGAASLDTIYLKKQENFVKEMRNIIDLPLESFYCSENFLVGKNVFNYNGTEDEYASLHRKIREANKLYLILPFTENWLTDSNFLVLEVKDKYRSGGL